MPRGAMRGMKKMRNLAKTATLRPPGRMNTQCRNPKVNFTAGTVSSCFLSKLIPQVAA
jgi:hypothetical protein